jgi:hypothetical protein
MMRRVYASVRTVPLHADVRPKLLGSAASLTGRRPLDERVTAPHNAITTTKIHDAFESLPRVSGSRSASEHRRGAAPEGRARAAAAP